MSKYALYQNPSLIDFLMVCEALPEDEREQWQVFSGSKYDPQAVAALYYQRACPKWVFYFEDRPLAVAGFDQLRQGVWQDWMFSTPDAWSPQHWRAVTRQTRKVMDHMLKTTAHRLQCVSLASRIQAHEWYRVLGLTLESPLEGYGTEGENALLFKRMKVED